ncbi:MAG: hypothetical protein DRP86_08140 [Candidatus Neomarinimicrobiota bacterium]|nr:MAG: hypothetical protein DRP86_08140 [Candidatus Neomarinimicrobiota bacterium]
MELDNMNVISSAVKESDARIRNTYILRIYNPGKTRQTTFRNFAFPFKTIEKNTFDKYKDKKLKKRYGGWRIILNNREIITLEKITKS